MKNWRVLIGVFVFYYLGFISAHSQIDSSLTIRGIVITQEMVLPRFIPTNFDNWKTAILTDTFAIVLADDPSNVLYNNSYIEDDSTNEFEFFRWVGIEITISTLLYAKILESKTRESFIHHSSHSYKISIYTELVEIDIKTVKFLW
ncbi:MAG: hypothetical protein R3D00_14150 [Bacteroidia bacterium]